MKLLAKDPQHGYLDTMLWIPKKLVNVEGAKRALTFELPDQGGVKLLALWEEAEHHLVVPRAFWNPTQFDIEVIDCRPTHYKKTGVRSRIKLDHGIDRATGKLVPTGDTFQREAIQALIAGEGGTLQLGCGRGKTVVALHFAAIKQVPVLIAVDNTQLLWQWKREIDKWLDVPGGVGLIQGNKKQWNKNVVLATYHALANWAPTMPERVHRWFGLLIAEEGHHINAPTFSRVAPLIYGYRLSLTATPNRTDGAHVIARYHIGDVLYKNVTQKTPPEISFIWTGLSLTTHDPDVIRGAMDKNGELHLRKLAVFFGSQRERLALHVLRRVKELAAEGRKVLVLSHAVTEVVNLMAMWTWGEDCDLYSDIPYPEPSEVGEKLEPLQLDKYRVARLKRTVKDININLANNRHLNPEKRQHYKNRKAELELELARYNVWRNTEKEYRRRQRAYVKRLVEADSTSGLFTEIVKPEDRFAMLKQRRVIFSIMKYGKEGLDDSDINGILVSMPGSDRNMLQQIMGRTRHGGKLYFLEDNVGPLINQCQKLRKYLRSWPVDEGGPFSYKQINHPSTKRRQQWLKNMTP